MEFLVEDGTGLANATSYISEAYLFSYAAATGAEIGAGDPKAACILASRWIDGRYGRRFPGTRLKGRAQGLLWPRADAVDTEGEEVADDAVPAEVAEATAIVALQELSSPGSLYPVTATTSTEVVKREKVGSLEVEYDTAQSTTTAIDLTSVSDILAPLLSATKGGGGMVPLLRA